MYGPAQTPTTPLDAYAPLSSSVSKKSSSRSPTDIVISRMMSVTSRRARPAARPASRSSESTSAGRLEPSAGGGRSISGFRNAAAVSNSASNGASASASRCETRATCSYATRSSFGSRIGWPSAANVANSGSSGIAS